VLRKALDHAVYLNLVSRNVCDIAKKSLPGQKRYEYHTLTKEQAQQLLAQVQGHRLAALLTVAITTGMRRGELVALRWSDIHFEEGYLQVFRSARRSAKAYGGLQVNEPKTASSRRKIALSPFLVEVLTRHHANQEKERQNVGSAWKEHGLVFCNRRGNLINPDDLTKWFKRQLENTGLQPMRFHDLRHSAATVLLVMGVHIKVVQELLGHSNVITTLNFYSHVLPSLQQEAMNKLSELFDQDSRGNETGDKQSDATTDDGQTE